VAIFDTENPYALGEIRGAAELTGDPNKELPKKLSRRYLGVAPPPEPPELQRLIVRVVPAKLSNFSV
jgi:hypothetical protein